MVSNGGGGGIALIPQIIHIFVYLYIWTFVKTPG